MIFCMYDWFDFPSHDGDLVIWQFALLISRKAGRHLRGKQFYQPRRWRSELQQTNEESTTEASSTSAPRSLPGRDIQSISRLVTPESNVTPISSDFVGEDAAVFDFRAQKFSSWLYFTGILAVVSAVMYIAWIDPSVGYGGHFIRALSSISSNHEVVMLMILFIFALVHSGMASFRDEGERLIGERAYRVVFAGLSLPLAVSAVVYFINHRYDGVQMWQLRTVPGIHELVWGLSFLSFFFLYPSTFNLLEVAAVDKPKMHLWETGIMRITRHPQMVGQLMWCVAHTLWIGNSFTLTTSLGLLAHHLFGVWNGDRRLAARYGEAYEVVKKRTSIVPFGAILEGRQILPKAYHKEFLRVPYFVIVGVSIGAYLSHPYLQIASHYLHW
ncbi:hypothetical protein O6H91_23G031000 [Diphasiastrum complanatum]|uniref:Uncharacterized protein n=1 Tax=Diphasiastrum complanatum TaxID=34168 RepID=A0ACC2AAL3_DIPCM|nr:hypothetical protein O6H91_23G031000 [Diphasiastrum complanatum]